MCESLRKNGVVWPPSAVGGAFCGGLESAPWPGSPECRGVRGSLRREGERMEGRSLGAILAARHKAGADPGILAGGTGKRGWRSRWGDDEQTTSKARFCCTWSELQPCCHPHPLVIKQREKLSPQATDIPQGQLELEVKWDRERTGRSWFPGLQTLHLFFVLRFFCLFFSGTGV
jgi:hypothetical protein